MRLLNSHRVLWLAPFWTFCGRKLVIVVFINSVQDKDGWEC